MKYRLYFPIILCATLLAGCANKASGPQGGPKDERPPKVLKETPLNGTLNYKKKTITVEFDEIIQVEKIQDNVLISPPQIKQPDIKAYNKKLLVTFNEELQDSTTYNIQFGNAIVDNNEKNPIKDYSFSFATGDKIDTLQISGIMLNAEDLNPISGILVGIYAEMDDSVFTKKPFLRIGKTDEKGQFSIKNVRAGKYKLFGLNDTSRDYMYQQGEGLAMYDSIIEPTFTMQQRQDTIWLDSVTVDSIHSFSAVRYLPDSILIRYFKESRQRQYFVKSERKEPNYFNLYFATASDSVPRIKSIETDWTNALLLQTNATNDSLTYWITDSVIAATDTLRFEMTYLKTDSLYELKPQTDTLTIVYRKPRIGAKVKKEEPKVTFLTIKNNLAGTFEIYNPITLQMGSPLSSIDKEKIHLTQIIDTIKKPLNFSLIPTDSVNIGFNIPYAWEAEAQYELQIDSAAMFDIYGHNNDAYSGRFKIRSLDEYSKIIIKVTPFNPQVVIQILDKKDVVVRTQPAKPEGSTFEYLKPDDYFLRMFIDENGDGKWTTGELAKHRQPENVFYYNKKLTLRANWDFEESWDYTALPLLQQKPEELKTDTSKKK